MDSKEIKVCGFRAGFPEAISDKINAWLASNDVEVVDIKISSTTHNSGVWLDALVIYKEKANF